MIPAVSEWWKWQQGKIFDELKDQELVVSGDGQCDSLGFTAKNLCYYLMDVATSDIIELEVLDKRETSMKSVQMEKQALHNILLILIIIIISWRLSSGRCYIAFKPKERAIANGQRSFGSFPLV